MTSTWRDLWQQTIDVLGERGPARWLCETACGLDGDEFTAALDESATERMVAQLDTMVARYRSGEPLAYVMNRWSFRTLDLMIDRRVLIPRPETELVAECAIDAARRVSPRVVVDLGTGSGAIGLSLAAELPVDGTEVWLTDASSDALDVARANVAAAGRGAANVRIAEGSWFDALPDQLRGRVSVIVSNPPYIAVGDPEVEESVREFEPESALFAGSDGLRDIETIVRGAREWLVPGGTLLVEVGHRQGDAVSALARDAGFDPESIEIRLDLAHRPRFLHAEL
ncbi:MAG: peptide chain release factor N(5)-glutamine methyltransferase [Actinomycetota bacterium]|nr:peptide chain release factor N(5)-glutamine methyltransferase [Actinomycetota bacterium]MDA2972172.1 peptide chain release factor N(5)-glutamine methyltransferase [Actinomycetota bacterium]MDA3001355.1 peptide chain release factor N(5)-glutamine methyltransferase [Actinomycetota bacterium]